MKTITLKYSLSRQQFVRAQKDILRAVTPSRLNYYWITLIRGLPPYKEQENRDISLTLSDSGIEFVRPQFATTNKWDYYSHVTETSDFILLVAADRSGATAIPKSAISDYDVFDHLPVKKR